MTELLSCPFCGSPAGTFGRNRVSCYVIKCAGYQLKATPDEWNTRAPQPSDRAAVIEECAKVAEKAWPRAHTLYTAQDYAVAKVILAIRALAAVQPVAEDETALFAAATKTDVAAAVRHIRNWTSYIDDHHRQNYADLIEAQAKLIAHLIAPPGQHASKEGGMR